MKPLDLTNLPFDPAQEAGKNTISEENEEDNGRIAALRLSRYLHQSRAFRGQTPELSQSEKDLLNKMESTKPAAPSPEGLIDESDPMEDMFEEDNLYLDRVQLAARGWTRSLTERFLPEPDRWATVDHWRNYTGKATYFVEKIIAAEQLVEFKKLYAVSISRRGLSRRDVNAFTRERTRVDAIYRSWLNTLGPEDIKNMIAADELSAAFEEARALGYRTPHK